MAYSSYPHLTSATATNATFINKKDTEATIIQADLGKNNNTALLNLD